MACSKDDEKKFEGGYELKTVDVDKDLECSICLLLLREAMGTPCSHAFCRVCLQKLIGQEDIRAATFICPDCQQPVDSDKVYPIAFVDRLVGRSDVYCSRKDEGCEWTGTLASFIQQHKSECNFQIVLCHHEGCVFSGIKSKIIDHESNCEYRMVKCEHCQADVKANLLDTHYSTCERIPTFCPQSYCDAIVPKIEIQNHLDEECRFVIVGCSYAKFGCPAEMLRNDLYQHNKVSTNQHMAFMRDQLSQSQSKIQDFKNEVNQLTIVNGELKNEVNKLRVEASVFKNKNVKETKIGEHSQLTRFDRSFHLKKLLLNGVEKWIKKNADAIVDERYKTWYEKIFSVMKENELCHFDSFMFIKLKNERRRQMIYWSSNDEEEHEHICDTDDFYYIGDNGLVLRDDGVKLVIETGSLDFFNFDNSKVFSLSRFGLTEEFTKDEYCHCYDGWFIQEISDDFYRDDFVIVCLIRM